MRFFGSILIALCLYTFNGHAQDIVVKTNGDIVRTTVIGTDYKSVKYKGDNGDEITNSPKEVKQFVWNGEAYILKTFSDKRRPEDRFAKIMEAGNKVSLYSTSPVNYANQHRASASNNPEQSIQTMTKTIRTTVTSNGISSAPPPRVRDMQRAPVKAAEPKVYFFIEKPGSGTLQEVKISNTEKTRALLLEKLGDNPALAERIKAAEKFDARLLVTYVRAYNESE